MMHESILPSPQLRPEDVVLGEHEDSSDAPSFAIREETKECSDEILVEQAEALGKQFDYDGSVLTPEQRRALFKKYWAMHLKLIGLRSPQYYGHKSQCLSVSEAAWPGAVTYLEAEKLKRGYIDPQDLIERLRKLKPSDNFELRKYRHRLMSWKSPTPLEEGGFEILPPVPEWLYDVKYALCDMEKRLGVQLTDRYRREIDGRWAAVESSVELTPLPDLHLLRDMGRSPGGTLFPWFLVKGLMALREHANENGSKLYDEEYNKAKEKREEAISRWMEKNPDSMLADDPLSIYINRTWPPDLMDELDEIDREAIRCGRRKYMALLRETEKKMQTLLAFWRDCGLVTGQRTSPSLWWHDPKAKVERLLKPQYLKERLDAIKAEFGYFTDKGKKLRMIETSCWLESIINSDSEPTAPDTPFPQSLLDELDIVWRDRDWLDQDDTEDEMIAVIRRWRKSQHQQPFDERLRTLPQLGSGIGPEEPVQKARSPVCSGQKNLLRDSSLGSVMAPEATRQLRENLSRGALRQARTKVMMAEDQAIWPGRLRPRTKTESQASWRDKLRPRSDAIGALRDRTKATKMQTGKPKGIVKRSKASKTKRPAATKGQATTSTTQNAYPSNLSITQSHFNESHPQAIPGSVAKARGTNSRRRSPRQPSAQAQGVQKARNSNRRQTRRLMGAALTTNRKHELHRLLTPPQSE
ncbi:hypothetical protein P154DRAFT_78454 [Amniculicola lignicola CBS 123094]|uniref:Uncharacterized protein n=1 Tax=Amniculicola lignicola CBS 123094 TaxID=1392246 RepID=A0A6A5W6N7_9PLEO|nr:hypothetical protein P154DRAFT_78454 [Amniculicola lignicola CBS 123094]